MGSRFSAQYPDDFSRMLESNSQLHNWAIEQQQQMRAFEESSAKAAWAAEFGSAAQNSSPASVTQAPPPTLNECMFTVMIKLLVSDLV